MTWYREPSKDSYFPLSHLLLLRSFLSSAGILKGCYGNLHPLTIGTTLAAGNPDTQGHYGSLTGSHWLRLRFLNGKGSHPWFVKGGKALSKGREALFIYANFFWHLSKREVVLICTCGGFFFEGSCSCNLTFLKGGHENCRCASWAQ